MIYVIFILYYIKKSIVAFQVGAEAKSKSWFGMTEAFSALDERWTILSETCWHAQRLLTQFDENDQHMDMDGGGGEDDIDRNNEQRPNRPNKDGDDGDGVLWFQQHVTFSYH